eukprot:4568324-Amphidinium_carterae.1
MRLQGHVSTPKPKIYTRLRRNPRNGSSVVAVVAAVAVVAVVGVVVAVACCCLLVAASIACGFAFDASCCNLS